MLNGFRAIRRMVMGKSTVTKVLVLPVSAINVDAEGRPLSNVVELFANLMTLVLGSPLPYLRFLPDFPRLILLMPPLRFSRVASSQWPVLLLSHVPLVCAGFLERPCVQQ
jgi:hypothetical protein